MLNNGPNHLSDEDDRGGPLSPCPAQHPRKPPQPQTSTPQWPRLMEPPPFLISTAAVINYVCPTPNTNIVIFWEGWGGVLIYFIVVAEGVRWMTSHHGRLLGRRGGGGAALEDVERASWGKLSPQGKTSSLGLVPPSAGTAPRVSRNLMRLYFAPLICSNAALPNLPPYKTFWVHRNSTGWKKKMCLKSFWNAN